MGWNTIDHPGARIATVYDSMDHLLGSRASARNTSDGFIGEFIFLKGVASTAAGKWVAINPDNFTTSLLADGHIGGVAVAMAATVASKYGWYQIYGKASGLLAASVADNAGLYTTGTAGQAGATSSGQSEIMGARAAAASGSSAANTEVELAYPNCGLSAAS